MTSLPEVLDVLADFDDAGGASLELTAWELGVEAADVEDAWRGAIGRGLLKPAGIERGSGEVMFRLSSLGWSAFADRSAAAGTFADGA